MARNRSPNRDKAFEIYKKHFGNIKTKEIAKLINDKYKNIEYWKAADSWDDKYNPNGGAPKGNKNAIGHKGISPGGNQNARKIGWYSKYMPVQSINIIKQLEESNANTLDILWAQITTQYAAIIRAQKIMFVKDHNDMTKELKKTKVQNDYIGPRGSQTLEETYREEEYELQFAWDKQAAFLNAQSRAMGELRSLIKQYEELLKEGLATEEQALRIMKLKTSITDTKDDIKNRKEIAKEKLQLDKERFSHQKEMDEFNKF